jgi:hypothetical protein
VKHNPKYSLSAAVGAGEEMANKAYDFVEMGK